MGNFSTVMVDKVTRFPLSQQFDNCRECPFLYRLSQSCPKYPDLYNPIPPDVFTIEDLAFPMNEVTGFVDYRTSMLLDLKTN